MRTKLVTLVFFCALLFSACEKETEIDPANEALCKNMLYFDSFEELDLELDKTKNMNDAELTQWANEKDFDSFGLIAKQKYDIFLETSFNNIDEIKNHVRTEQKYLQLIDDSDGELVLETNLYRSSFKYIANDNKVFQVGDKIFKVYETDVIFTNIENLSSLLKMNYKEAINANFISLLGPASSNKSSLGCGDTDDDKKQSGRNRVTLHIDCGHKHKSDGGHIYVKMGVYSYKRFIVWVREMHTISYDVNVKFGWRPDFRLPNTIIYETWNPTESGKRASSIEDEWDFNWQFPADIDPEVHFEGYNCWARVPDITEAVKLSCNTQVLQ